MDESERFAIYRLGKPGCYGNDPNRETPGSFREPNLQDQLWGTEFFRFLVEQPCYELREISDCLVV
jgi:hypothetical protein